MQRLARYWFGARAVALYIAALALGVRRCLVTPEDFAKQVLGK